MSSVYLSLFQEVSTMSEKLTINGGEKAVTLDQTEAMEWPQFCDEDFEAVKRVMKMARVINLIFLN